MKWTDDEGQIIHIKEEVNPLREQRALEVVAECDEEDESAGSDAGEADEIAEAGGGGERKAVFQSRFSTEVMVANALPEDVLLAFSHWTYFYSKWDYLVYDLQGCLTRSKFRLTDPAIHSRGRGNKFGDTDNGLRGMQNFFKTHQWNSICKLFHKIRFGDFFVAVQIVSKKSEKHRSKRTSPNTSRHD
eukprot:Selendium_serpulae@DN6206_c0_g1_i2.p1